MSEDITKEVKKRGPSTPKFYTSRKLMMKLFTVLQAFVYKTSKGRLWRTIKGCNICVNCTNICRCSKVGYT